MMESDVFAALVVAFVFMVVSMVLVTVAEWVSAVVDAWRDRDVRDCEKRQDHGFYR